MRRWCTLLAWLMLATISATGLAACSGMGSSSGSSGSSGSSSSSSY
ncbi:hypothetical protein WJ542_10400 [Paraburkholderia sp. B3]